MSNLPGDHGGGRWPTVTVPAKEPQRVVEAMASFIEAVDPMLVPASPVD